MFGPVLAGHLFITATVGLLGVTTIDSLHCTCMYTCSVVGYLIVFDLFFQLIRLLSENSALQNPALLVALLAEVSHVTLVEVM